MFFFLSIQWFIPTMVQRITFNYKINSIQTMAIYNSVARLLAPQRQPYVDCKCFMNEKWQCQTQLLAQTVRLIPWWIFVLYMFDRARASVFGTCVELLFILNFANNFFFTFPIHNNTYAYGSSNIVWHVNSSMKFYASGFIVLSHFV